MAAKYLLIKDLIIFTRHTIQDHEFERDNLILVMDNKSRYTIYNMYKLIILSQKLFKIKQQKGEPIGHLRSNIYALKSIESECNDRLKNTLIKAACSRCFY